MHTLSVIIPCRNESAILAITLPRIVAELSHGAISEVILVDNNSTDNSTSVARSYPGIKVYTCAGTISEVRNFGAAQAHGDIFCFVDADVEIESGWSQKILEFVEKSGTAIDSTVFGNVYGIPRSPTWIERLWFQSLRSRRQVSYINGGNLMVTRRFFQRLGGFNRCLITGEDVDFCQRAKALGGKVVLLSGLKTIHHGYPKSLTAFYKREKWHGSGMLAHLRTPWRSKPLLAALGLLLMPIALPGMLWLVGPVATLGLVLAGSVSSLALAAHRCERRFSLDPFRLLLLFLVYTVARAHAVLEGIVSGHRSVSQYQGRNKLTG